MARRAQSTSPKQPQSESKAEERWWKVPAVIAAVIAALATISVALIYQRTASTPHPSNALHITQQTHGSDSPAIAGVQGSVTVTRSIHITNIQGISAEEHERLSKEFGVTDAALKSFFKILEQQQVPREDLDSTLRDIAKKYKTLQEQLQAFTSDDSAVLTLKQAASKALEAGDFARAEKLLNDASQKELEGAQQFQAMATKRWLSAAASKAELGTLKATQLRYAEAALYYHQAVQLVESIPKPSEEMLATYLSQWGLTSLLTRDFVTAELALTRALTIQEKVLGPEHSEVANSFNNLGMFYSSQGKYTKGEPLLRRALAIQEKMLGPEHPEVSSILLHLGGLYTSQGKYTEGEPLLRRALTIQEKALGPEHSEVANSLIIIGMFYSSQGKYAKGEPLLTRALAIHEKVLGPEHPEVANDLAALATLYGDQGRFAEAERALQQALTISEKALGPEHLTVGIILRFRAENYIVQGRYGDAEQLLERALAIWEKVWGSEHWTLTKLLETYAELLRKTNRAGEAAKLETRARAIETMHTRHNAGR